MNICTKIAKLRFLNNSLVQIGFRLIKHEYIRFRASRCLSLSSSFPSVMVSKLRSIVRPVFSPQKQLLLASLS